MNIENKDIQSIAEAHAHHAKNMHSKSMSADSSRTIAIALDVLILGFSKELKTDILNRSREIRRQKKKVGVEFKNKL